MRKTLELILKLFSQAILNKYRPKIVAITGSAGKTSAKEAIFLVLNSAFPGKVRCNIKNFNTEIGVPLTIIDGEDAGRDLWLWLKNFTKAVKLILFLDPNYPEILVLEMAADRPGDIRYLTSFVYPDMAVVTAIGEMPVHLEFFPEKDDYVGEKATILRNLRPYGAAILNYDDLAVREFRNMVPTNRSRTYYGFEAGAEVRLSDFNFIIPSNQNELETSGIEFSLSYNGETAGSRISKTLGVPPLYAALAATAVGLRFELKLKNIAEYLKKYDPPANRLELKKGIKETILINDAYNASPLAMEAALDLLTKFKKNRRIAVLGSMRELGINTEEAHRLVGRRVARVADVVFLIGDEMALAKEEALKINMKLGEDLFWFDTSAEASKKIQEIIKPGDVILIKGSRAVKMETIVKEIAI